jgi:hypothetical protein
LLVRADPGQVDLILRLFVGSLETQFVWMSRAVFTLPLVVLPLCQCCCDPKLSRFETDGCSGFADRAGDCDWSDCCKAHDHAYWKGGTREERLAADRKLRECVIQQGGSPLLGSLMFTGVRIFGIGWLPTPFRWGFGWNCLRPSRPLNEAEQAQVQSATTRGHDLTNSMSGNPASGVPAPRPAPAGREIAGGWRATAE